MTESSFLRRFSSRIERLDHAFLRDRLREATTYDRIAGYFRSSIFEVAAEEIARIDRVRIVCNSDLDPDDLRTSQAVRAQLMRERWWEGGRGELPVEVESLLHRARYRRLAEMLAARDANGRPKIEIRVVDRQNAPLVHGKAGIITRRDGGKSCFVGSVNETLDAWSKHYEIVWEDSSDDGVAWTQAEFDFLWEKAVALPDAIIAEVKRCADRVEIAVPDCPAWELGGETDIARAAMAEAPIVRSGAMLQPWQKSFVAEFLRHRDWYGKARLLLADEVGVGKTLSLATSALASALLDDGPVLILAPATLCEQWQAELKDKLGVPSARWLSNRKEWIDAEHRVIRTRGAEDVARCPTRIAIVSTGLIVQGTAEAEALLARRAAPGEAPIGTLILDEAHKARASAQPGQPREPNNLLKFMIRAAAKARHVLLGTATPIQTDIRELWDQLEILSSGASHVFGGALSPWRKHDEALAITTGRVRPRGLEDAWAWLRFSLPAGKEADRVFSMIRGDLGLGDDRFETDRSWTDLDTASTRPELEDRLTHDADGLGFLQRNNPIVRHTILRKRKALEQEGLLTPVAVDLHPMTDENEPVTRAFFGAHGKAVATSAAIDAATAAAERYCAALGQRSRGAAYLRSLILQRICSSAASGRATAERLLAAWTPTVDGRAPGRELDENEELAPREREAMAPIGEAERDALREIVARMGEVCAQPHDAMGADPKWRVVRHYLIERGWLRHGCIVFSQYYDTVRFLADTLALALPETTVAVYAGADRSGMHRDGHFAACPREAIKHAVREGAVKLVIATDAACEGLNLQTLGTLINVDLPWNPSRLQQRIGRIQRFGQRRPSVDMLSLVYENTRDEVIYERLSARMKDRFDLFGQVPDVIEDEWTENAETYDRECDRYINNRRVANPFDLRWGGSAAGAGLSADERKWQDGWETCAKVISRRDVVDKMNEGWSRSSG